MLSLKQISNKLRRKYGKPETPRVTDPFEMVIWENVAYLVDDVKREEAFTTLREQIGLKPTDILSATMEELIEVLAIGGVAPQLRAQRLKESAQILLIEHDGDSSRMLDLPLPKAVKALKQFPAIGAPGAEKILLYSRKYPLLAMESNALRVLLRLGFGEEKKNYSASYKAVQQDVAPQLGTNYDSIIELLQLLRLHGRFTCKTNKPRCEQCPLRDDCQYYREGR